MPADPGESKAGEDPLVILNAGLTGPFTSDLA
jgi:hypothetical protein